MIHNTLHSLRMSPTIAAKFLGMNLRTMHRHLDRGEIACDGKGHTRTISAHAILDAWRRYAHFRETCDPLGAARVSVLIELRASYMNASRQAQLTEAK